MNPTTLAGLVKRAYPNFKMEFFDNRLKLQKLIYLMQASKLNLGYNFKLYLHGPYCTVLAREGFDMPTFDNCKRIAFEEPEHEKQFEFFLNFISNKKDLKEDMEILASLHLFHKMNIKAGDDEVIEFVKNKNPIFKDKEKKIKSLLHELKGSGVIEW